MRKIIIVGATSGIGKGLAELYAKNDCMVGIIGRRRNLLERLSLQDKSRYIYKVGDVSSTSIVDSLNWLYNELDGLDLLILSAGTGDLNAELEYSIEESTINTNIVGFTRVINWGYKIFEAQKKGHLVIISSLAGIRGSGFAPAYNASKSYQMNYIEGLRQKSNKQNLPITITDIRPGFVDTAMAKGEELFWVVPKNKAVNQMYNAINKKRKIVVVSKRWRLVSMLLKILPSSIYSKM